jgi:hypothetical protein
MCPQRVETFISLSFFLGILLIHGLPHIGILFIYFGNSTVFIYLKQGALHKEGFTIDGIFPIHDLEPTT